jgi:hypothetical protein
VHGWKLAGVDRQVVPNFDAPGMKIAQQACFAMMLAIVVG